MTIDTGALRKFQEVWGPAVAAIPAVLDMVDREADLNRGIEAKRLELEKAQQKIDAAYAEADKRLMALNDEMSTVMARKTAVTQEISAAQNKAQEEAAAAEKQKQAALDALQGQIVAVQSQLQGLQGEYAAKKAQAEAEHAQAVKAMNAEIAGLEAKKAAAEKALDAIKAKLG